MDLLVYVVLGLIFVYFLLRKQKPKLGRQIPGPKAWPIIGNLLDMQKGEVHEVFADLAEQYGEIFQVSVFGKSFVVLNSANMVRTAFCMDRYVKWMSDRVNSFYGNSALFGSRALGLMPKAYGSPHGELRKVYVKGLHIYGDGRKEFETLVMSELEKLTLKFEELNGKEFDMVEVLKRSLSNVLSILLTGKDIKDGDEDWNIFWELDKGADFFLKADNDAVLQMFPFLRRVPGKYKYRYDALMTARDKCLKRMFYDTKATYKEGRIRGLVDYFIQQQLQTQITGNDDLLTDETIMATILETVVGALLTTTVSLSSTFLCLLNHPNYQTMIQEELDRIVGTDRLPQLSDRQECIFTEALSMEVQRYNTVFVPSVARSCEPNIEFEGYDIPANSMVISNTYHIHHDKTVWGDPWTFRPERWITETGELLPNDHILRKNWLPFGTGRRQCIGESLARNRMFLYLSTLLRRWTFVTSPEYAVSSDPRDGHFVTNLACRPKSYICRAVARKDV